ncbi:MAG: type VI secretion protein IcmF/TssM N-terminal domain-containing protein [Pirellulaceae bacterium]|nr:type VI secretion protein IcmF/TssM N-terminal domain-containing protein [Pirellulaceae bacterium]
MLIIHSIVDKIASPIRFFVYWFKRAIPGARAMGSISLPWKWSLISFFFLLCIFVAAIVKQWMEQAERGGIEKLRWWFLALGLILSIPVLVFYFVKYLLMEEKSRYPEIDRIWKEGCEEAEAKGTTLSMTPLFLVLGVPSSRETNALLKSSGIEFVVNQPGHGDSDISFHATSQAVFLFINGCSCISRLSTTKSTASATAYHEGGTNDQDQPDLPGGTIDASFLKSDLQRAANPQTAQDSSRAAPFTPGGTMLLEDGQDIAEVLSSIVASKQLSSIEVADCEDRLKHVCKIIKASRLPLCPFNGMIAAIPFELVEVSDAQLQIAAQKDLAILRRELLVRCPVTVMITGLEREEGFVELMRRLPPDKLKENRFGKGSEPWVAPESARLEAIGAHATASFEDWSYLLFQEREALKKNNATLFTMLCRMRGTFAENLIKVLSRGFGYDPKIEAHLAYEQFLFGGCYFAATSSNPKEQAFVKSVFEKAIQQEGELEWSPEARQADSNFYFLANIAAMIGMIALAAIMGMLIHKFLLSVPPE